MHRTINIALILKVQIGHPIYPRRKRMIDQNRKNWTFDCGVGNNQSGYTSIPSNANGMPAIGGSANASTAFLLRPISTNSVHSSSGVGHGNGNAISISPKALAAAVAEASSAVNGGEKGALMSKSEKNLDANTGSSYKAKCLHRRRHNSCRTQMLTPSPLNQTLAQDNANQTADNAADAIEYASEGTRLLPPERATSIFQHSQNANRHNLPRQHSDAGAYGMGATQNAFLHSKLKHNVQSKAVSPLNNDTSTSARLIKTSYSQGIALVRGHSCSLVDIPTYLVPSLQACGGVELVTICPETGKSINKAATPALPPRCHSSKHKPLHLSPHPSVKGQSSGGMGQGGHRHKTSRIKSIDHMKIRQLSKLQLEVTEEDKKELREKNKVKAARKAKWAVLCVSLALLTMCVMLVGTMLSIGSQYQVKV